MILIWPRKLRISEDTHERAETYESEDRQSRSRERDGVARWDNGDRL